jgi:hypothetical protein
MQRFGSHRVWVRGFGVRYARYKVLGKSYESNVLMEMMLFRKDHPPPLP